MTGSRHLPTLAVLIGIAILASMALLASDDAQATVTGKSIPSLGSDWVIDTDTYVRDEALISLRGDIIVEPGYILDIEDSKIVIESSNPGQQGILVDADTSDSSQLVLKGVTIEALVAGYGWTFMVYGDANISSCILDDIHDGLQIFGGTVLVSGCTISATGSYGILIEGASPSITNTDIDLVTDGQGSGIEVLSTPTVTSKPHLEDLEVTVDADVTVSSSSSSTTVNLDLFGIRAIDSDLGTLQNIEILHGASIDVTITNAGNPRLYLYIASIGLRLEGGTSVTDLINVFIQGHGFDASITYPGTRTCTLYSYNRVAGLSNEVNDVGACPATINGISITDHVVSILTTGNINHNQYDNSYGILWQPDAMSIQGQDLVFQFIKMVNLSVDVAFDVDDEWNLTIEQCNISQCYFENGILVMDGWTHDIVVRSNLIMDNMANAGVANLFHALKMSGDLDITDNQVMGNMVGSFLTVDAPMGGVTVNINTFEDNMHDYDLIMLTGLGILAENALVVQDNEFIDNECQTIDYALIKVEHPKQNVTIRDNTFTNNTGDGIGFFSPYSNYATFPHPDFTISVLDNTFEDTNGYSIVFMNFDNNNIVVRGNEATGCRLAVIKLDQDSVYYSNSNHWGSMVTYLQGPDSLVVRDNDFAANPGGGMNLRVSRYDSKYIDQSGNPYAEVVIRDNDLSDSGGDGWAIYIIGLYNKPDIANNDMDGSVDGQHMGIIEDTVKRNPFVMIFDGHVMDGGLDGRIAFGFAGISATFYNCTFVNYSQSIKVDSAEVVVMWSQLPMGSGYAISGTISVYNHLEILVCWADIDGVDSTMPITGASVSLTAHDGRAIEALTTDTRGRTPVTIVKVWEMTTSTFVTNSPIKVAISAKGEYIEHFLPVESDLAGAHVAVLTLVDRHVPSLTVSSPWTGSVLSTQDITLKGVLTEFGSGIVYFGARHDGMATGEWVTIDPETLWSCTFTGIPSGPHEFIVKVEDLAKNTVLVRIDLTVDTVLPTLEGEPAYLDGTPPPYDEATKSYYVTSTPILIDGMYEDDRTDPENIVIRLDGTILTALGGQLGLINLRVPLHEGTNVLMLDATDLAGNRAVLELRVILDSAPPVLYVTYPLSGLETLETTITVTGLTEPSTMLKFQIESVLGTRVYDHVEGPDGDMPILSEEDGTFAFDIEPFEGIQVLIVSTEDAAGNIREVEIDLVLDTEAPEFVINNPEEAVTVTQANTLTLTGTIIGEFNVMIIVNGQSSAGTGIFSVEVPLHEGENLIEVTAVDAVGNSKTELRTVIVDTLSPVLVVTSPEGVDILLRDTSVYIGGTIVGSSPFGGNAGVFLTIKGTDADATLASGTWEEGVWEYNLELGPTDLDQEIMVTAVDAAGNEVVRTFRLRFDVIPPSLQVDVISDTTKTSMIDINGTTDDGISTIWVNGIPHPVVGGVFTVTCFLVPGDNTITMEVMDAAGNTQTVVRTTNLEWEDPGAEPTTSTEETSNLTAYAIALIVAGLAVLVIAVIMSGDRQRRDA